MANFFKNLFSKKSKKGYEIVNKKGICLTHDTTLYSDIKANHYCNTCNTNMCYMCSGNHFENKCDIFWSKEDIQLQAANSKVEGLNQGYLTKFSLKNLFCPCGTKIDYSQPSAGMCVACGTATCSTDCHTKYSTKTNQCTFHKNFDSELEAKNMRSLLFRNVQYLNQHNYPIFTRATRTSQNFITGLTSEDDDMIFLQRGFRQYGNPLPETLDNMEVIYQKNMDFYLHSSRKCDCDCFVCGSKDAHPVYNCDIDCRKKEVVVYNDLSQDERMQDICDCECSFCSSGITVLKHRKLDCVYHCEHSPFQKNSNN